MASSARCVVCFRVLAWLFGGVERARLPGLCGVLGPGGAAGRCQCVGPGPRRGSLGSVPHGLTAVLAALVLAQAVRGFAAEAGAVRLPPQFTVAGRYAAALYMAASKAGALDNVSAELGRVTEIMASSDEFRNFVLDPTIPQGAKQAGVSSVLEGLGASEITRNFVALVSDNRRLTVLDQILEKFKSLVSEQKGDVNAVITTAARWSDADIADVSEELTKLLGAGRKVTLTQRVDPDILGGIVLDVEDKHVDLSVATRVREVQNLIRAATI